jgi:hypothetical protein
MNTRITFTAYTLDDIISKVNDTCDILKKTITIKRYERTTQAGYFMRPHRDDYRYDKQTKRWVPLFNRDMRPLVTVIWFHSTQGIDFMGGNLRFNDGTLYRPSKNLAVLFDSNDIHEVTTQTTKKGVGDTRHITILKWYETVS